MFFPRTVLASIFIACCLTTLTSGATAETPPDEVEALKSIGKALGKTDWNFNINVDPCRDWEAKGVDPKGFDANNITCNCTFNDNTTCHVIGIFLKAQNLSGQLPLELDGLPYLQHIDLTRNYLSGPIPPGWGRSAQLMTIDLLGNRLSGPIPEQLASLSNLTGLVLEHNNLSGTLPPRLGDLPKIEKIYLNSNNFTGGLPETFANLTTVKLFRISDNNFTGNIPDFIFRNWTNLTELYIEGSGLSGPIPDVSGLENLKYILISDLNGAEANFPEFSNLPKLERLMLRSCNLAGELPPSLWALTTKLKILDVSFNKLEGVIPSGLSDTNLDQLFLTGNMFTGPVPQWILNTKEEMDVSYNQFNSTGVRGCKQNNVNLFASTLRANNSGIVSCLNSTTTCGAEPLHSLYINCGGGKEFINGSTYEADQDGAGPSAFFQSNFWAFSSTGIFLGDDRSKDILVVGNAQLSITAGEPYRTARLSPNSLTYYVSCLDKTRRYNVDLHFAEIQFTDGQNFSSLGRRIFDVYIQGERVLKDFNIKDEAGGAGKPLVKPFNNVSVTDGTLEIHLRWAGKGTTAIPVRGVYGPLISAISVVDPDYKPPSSGGGGISAALVGGIVAGAVFASFLILGILWWNGCLRRQRTLEQDLKGIELHTSSFSLRQIKAATNNFDAANKIGEGGFGPVYKGTLEDGTVIAVKQLSAKSRQGNREFVTEIGMISALQHPHLVKLHGCCIEGNQLLLIYEYLENNSLHRALFGPEEAQLKLDWPTRRKICIGIARGLAYLHEESRLKVVHRDIKSTNVLLDKDLNPKISDFGLAKLNEEDDTHVTTRNIAGTYGYMAPEYAMHGHLSDKADVYSFGIVALEIVSGRCNTKNRPKEEPFYLLDWAHVLKEKEHLLDIVDPRIGSDCNVEEVTAMINVALLCTNPAAAARPSMSSVVSMLEGKANVEEFVRNSSISANELHEEAMKKFYRQIEEIDAGNIQTKSMLADGPWTSSSTSAADLYPVNLTSGYLQNRDSTN